MRTLAGPVSIHICFCHLLSATGAIVNVNVYNITEILCEREDREELLERLKDPLSNNQGTKSILIKLPNKLNWFLILRFTYL